MPAIKSNRQGVTPLCLQSGEARVTRADVDLHRAAHNIKDNHPEIVQQGVPPPEGISEKLT
eukprot:11953981-Heterocapsa_arctica.AAC.1